MITKIKLGKTNGINSVVDIPSMDVEGTLSRQSRSSDSQIVPPPS